MLGLRRRNEDENNRNSWNFSLGFIVDPDTKLLGKGLDANKPLPEGETEIRFKKESQTGIMLVTSSSF